MDGSCSPSLRCRPVLRSPFTRAYNRRERARTVSTVRIRLPSRSCPLRARTAKTTLGWEPPTRVYFNIPIHIAGGTGPNQGRFGTLGRDSFRGPAYYDYDFALIKDTPFGRRGSGAERMDVQFRGEFFNLFNIVNMGLPSNIVTGSGFGEISKTAGTSRQIQLSLKLIY